MTVQSYIFQSPYSSQVQIGRPDPSAKQDSQGSDTQTLENTNQTLQEAKSFQATQTQDVSPSVTTNQHLDLYA
jgi:hypothetical protein